VHQGMGVLRTAEERMDHTQASAAPPRRKICPRCGGLRFVRSRRSRLERLLGLLRLRPYRCGGCHARFWRFGRGSVPAPPLVR
jgi:hypothetical protein